MKHATAGRAPGWSGSPEDLAEVARKGQEIVRSAGGREIACTITVTFNDGTRNSYEAREEFVAELAPSDLPRVQSISIGYHQPMFVGDDAKLAAQTLYANVSLYAGPRGPGPYIAVEGDELSLVEGVTTRLVDTFSAPGPHRKVMRRRPGMRLHPPGHVSRLSRLQARVGTLGIVAATAAVSTTVAVLVTKLLS